MAGNCSTSEIGRNEAIPRRPRQGHRSVPALCASTRDRDSPGGSRLRLRAGGRVPAGLPTAGRTEVRCALPDGLRRGMVPHAPWQGTARPPRSEETKRFLDVLAKGIDPFRHYARRHGIAIHLEGLGSGYELEGAFRRAFPLPEEPKFDAHFLMDYEEEWFLTPHGRELLDLRDRKKRSDSSTSSPRASIRSGTMRVDTGSRFTWRVSAPATSWRARSGGPSHCRKNRSSMRTS